MIFSLLLSLFSLEGILSTALDPYVKRPGRARFTIRRLMVATLPEPYFTLSEESTGVGLTGRHCLQRCLKDIKKKEGSCAYARFDVYEKEFGYPAYQRAPFEQLILRTLVKACWLYEGNNESNGKETMGRGVWNRKTGERGKDVLAVFLVESERTPFPPEPWHPEVPENIEILDDRFNNYLAQKPVYKLCNQYLNPWPEYSPDDSSDHSTTISTTRQDTESSTIEATSVPTVPLYAYNCEGSIVQSFRIQCGRPVTRMFDILLSQEPVVGCENVGVFGGGMRPISQTMNATQAVGWCAKEVGCAGAEQPIGMANRTYGGMKIAILTDGNDINQWCHVNQVFTHEDGDL